MIALIAGYTIRTVILGLLVFLALKALRVQDPRLERTVWRVVLASAVSMPVLLKLISLAPVPTATLKASYVELVTFPAANSISDWNSALLIILASISSLLLVRHCIGVVRCWTMRQRAARLALFAHGALDVRVSSEVRSPATVFSTILVPADFEDWSPETQRLAIAHEQSHVSSKDFYVQGLAQVYRSLCWFNPLAWWLANRLALLNEHISDDAAIDCRDEPGRSERVAYARILVSLAQRGTASAHLVPMIRTQSLGMRVERILQHTGAGRASLLESVLVACALAPILTASAAIQAPSNHSNHGNNLRLLESEANLRVVLPRSNPAKPLSQPSYPSASRLLGETGTVVLKLHVLEDGTVGDAAIEKSSGHLDLDYAAFYEAFRWRLDPGTVDGAPLRMWGRFAVTFKLAND